MEHQFPVLQGLELVEDMLLVAVPGMLLIADPLVATELVMVMTTELVGVALLSLELSLLEQAARIVVKAAAKSKILVFISILSFVHFHLVKRLQGVLVAMRMPVGKEWLYRDLGRF